VNVETPALIRGYLRCGAELLGPPAYDSDFNTADLPMPMSFTGLPRRHCRHFLGVEVDGRLGDRAGGPRAVRSRIVPTLLSRRAVRCGASAQTQAMPP
jgi:hypothetical protein